MSEPNQPHYPGPRQPAQPGQLAPSDQTSPLNAPAVATPNPISAATEPIPAPPTSTPYRLPDPPLADLSSAAEVPFARTGPRPWAIFGPALSVFGALLWSFVVAGQFTTSWMTGGPISQGLAVLLVFTATLTAWITSLRASRAAAPPRSFVRFIARVFTVPALAFVFFLIAISAMTVVGSVASRNHDFFFAFLLVVLAMVAAVLGRRLTWPGRPEGTHRARTTHVALWIAGAFLTLLAGAELAANG